MSTPNTNTPTKKINPVDILLSVLPLIVMLCLNTAFTLPAFILGYIDMAKNGNVNENNITNALESPVAQTALSIGFIAYAVTAIIVFYIWYKKAFLKKQVKMENKEVFTVKTVIVTILGTIGVWSIVNLAITGVNFIAPDLIESFNNLMENSGFGINPITTFFYVSILGPIAEELMFRGVTQAYLRRSGAPVAVVLIGQAIMFGIAHMNPVQSTYAVFIGLFIGLLRYKFGNIRICCLAHIVNNTFASYAEVISEAIGLSETVTYVLFGIMSVVAVFAIIFISKQPTKDKGIDLRVAG